MSLQNLFNPDNVDNPVYTLFANDITVNELDVNVINHTGDDAITADDLTVTGDLIAAGNNYSTADLGQPNYSLHTDGAGSTFWAPDDTGSGDIGYNGIAPTVAGQLSRFSGVDGLTVDQSAITDDGANLDLNNQNITNVNLVDGVDIPAFKLDYDDKINQNVKILSSPTFNFVQGVRMSIFDQVTNSYTYDLRSNNGQMQLYNDTGNVQMRIDSNDAIEIVNTLRVVGNTNMFGAATFNTGANTYVLPTTRPAAGQILGAQDSGGGLNWYPTISAPMGELQYGDGGPLNYNVTLTTINQWYELGSLTNEILTTNNAEFSLPKFQQGAGPGQLRYIGNKTSQFKISYSYSGSSASANRSFQMCLSINGVIINSSIVDTDYINNTDHTTFTANKMLLLGTNNYVSILVRCTTTAGEIINIRNTNICALSSSLQLL